MNAKWGGRAMKVCEKCGSKRLRLEVPPDFEAFEVCQRRQSRQ